MHKSHKDILKFLEDESFVAWVNSEFSEYAEIWTDYILRNPDEESAVRESVSILQGIYRSQNEDFTQESDKVWKNIENFRSRKGRGRISFILKIAASFIILILAGTGFYYFGHKPSINDLQSFYPVNDSLTESSLIINSDNAITLFGNKLDINLSSGVLLVNSEKGLVFKHDIGKDPKRFQLNVPSGKWASIKLSDASIINLNSNSKIVFSSRNNLNSRQVHIEGEAYFKVTKHENLDFNVFTRDFRVNVKGTSFNVKAYSEIDFFSTFLEEGSIELSAIDENLNQSAILLHPGQFAVSDSKTGFISVSESSDNQLTTWYRGYLTVKGVGFLDIIDQLSRIYGFSYRANIMSAEAPALTGDLVLRENIDSIFSVISEAIPVCIEKKGDYYLLSVP